MTEASIRLRVLPGIPGTDGREIELQEGASAIQWRYIEDATGVYDWQDLIDTADLIGATGPAVELRTDGTNLQYRVAGSVDDDDWVDIAPITDLGGPPGPQGPAGPEFYLTTIAELEAVAAVDRFDGDTRIVQSAITGQPARVFSYQQYSLELVNGETIVLPDDLVSTDSGRWVAEGADIKGALQIGQSQSQQNATRTVTVTGAAAYPPTVAEMFPTTPSHSEITTADNGGGSFDISYVGKTVEGIFTYYPSTGLLGAITGSLAPFESGFNNIGLGQAVAYREKTGNTLAICKVDEGSRPIERFLPSSTLTVSGATNATTCVVSVSDLRLIPQTVTVPIRFGSVGGMTELNSGTYYAKTPNPAWTTYRDSPVAVPGTIELYSDSAGTVPVNSSAFGAYTSGGTLYAHHLLDQLDDDAPATLALLGASAFELFNVYQGEANGGALPSDTVSTTGGVATFLGYQAKVRELLNVFEDRGWINGSTKIFYWELSRVNTNSAEKPRNDVISTLGELDSRISVVSSQGYTADDLTHIDDHYGHGYHRGGEALDQALKGTQAQIALPFYARSMIRANGTLTTIDAVKDLTDETWDLSGLTNFYRGSLIGYTFYMHNADLIIPALAFSAGDRGIWFDTFVWSVTNGSSTVQCTGYDFRDMRTNTITADSITLTETYTPFRMRFVRSGEISVSLA